MIAFCILLNCCFFKLSHLATSSCRFKLIAKNLGCLSWSKLRFGRLILWHWFKWYFEIDSGICRLTICNTWIHNTSKLASRCIQRSLAVTFAHLFCFSGFLGGQFLILGAYKSSSLNWIILTYDIWILRKKSSILCAINLGIRLTNFHCLLKHIQLIGWLSGTWWWG